MKKIKWNFLMQMKRNNLRNKFLKDTKKEQKNLQIYNQKKQKKIYNK